MADVLALSWDRRRLCGIEVSPNPTHPRVTGGFSVEWPEQPPTVAWLRATLQRYKIGSRQVAVALPREDAVLRLLELPNVPDAELPTLVRFQAAARSAQSIDQLLLDYLPLPHRPEVSQKEVWLATTLLSTVDPIRSLLTGAGLELTQFTISSLCLTELIVRTEAQKSTDAFGASLIVYRTGSRMDLAVVAQKQLIAAHAVKWPANEIPPATKMLSEVSRVLVQVQAWLPEGTLQRAWVIGEDFDVGELPDAIGQRWKCPVQRCDPLRDGVLSLGNVRLDGPTSEYAIAAGLALSLSGSLTPKIDLLHPRQPPPKVDHRKPYIAAAAAGGLLVAALSTGIVQQTLASYDSQIEKLREEDAKLGRSLKENEPISVASSAVTDWQAHNINQLNQIAELHQVMNGTGRLVVGTYQFNQSVGNVIAKLKIAGSARDRSDTSELTQNLASLKKFVIKPSSLTTTSNDPEYVSRFDFEMDLVPVNAKPASTKPAGGNPPSATKPGK